MSENVCPTCGTGDADLSDVVVQNSERVSFEATCSNSKCDTTWTAMFDFSEQDDVEGEDMSSG